MTSTLDRVIRPIATALTMSLLAILAGCGGGDGTLENRAQASEVKSTQEQALTEPNVTVLPATATPQTYVVSLQKVREVRVSRTVFDFVFRVTLENTGAARAALMATAVSAVKGVEIVEGSVLIGDVGANTLITPEDTITLRIDRSIPFDQGSLNWIISDPINGFPVPPEPAPIVNDATLAGVDTNRNGVRDDVERKLAALVSNDTDFRAILRYAKEYQSLITGSPISSRDQAVRAFQKVACAAQLSSSSVRQISVTSLLATTPTRQTALRNFTTVLGYFSSSEIPSCAN